ncbi:MAG: hypothetical protein IPH30_16890 [Betaproteobacteria bacterium]|nr:hypothetical protein [Betaproteobacteria bacterium]
MRDADVILERGEVEETRPFLRVASLEADGLPAPEPLPGQRDESGEMRFAMGAAAAMYASILPDSADGDRGSLGWRGCWNGSPGKWGRSPIVAKQGNVPNYRREATAADRLQDRDRRRRQRRHLDVHGITFDTFPQLA